MRGALSAAEATSVQRVQARAHAYDARPDADAYAYTRSRLGVVSAVAAYGNTYFSKK
jgi:hypothetical protein